MRGLLGGSGGALGHPGRYFGRPGAALGKNGRLVGTKWPPRWPEEVARRPKREENETGALLFGVSGGFKSDENQ